MSLAPGLQWGTWDKDSDLISFPNLQCLQAALKDITHSIDITYSLQGRLTYIPVTEEQPGDPSWFLSDERTVSSLSAITNRNVCHVCVETKDHAFNQYNTFMEKIFEHPNGSVVFPNKLKYFSDVLLYTDVIGRVYPSTYPAKKVDLQVFLMGTEKNNNSVFRFFKHTLCERRVLDLVKKF